MANKYNSICLIAPFQTQTQIQTNKYDTICTIISNINYSAMCVIERKYPASELKYSNGCQRLGDHHIWNKWIRTNLSERYSNKVKLPVHWSHTIPFRLKHVQQFSLQKNVLKKGFHFSVKKLILFPRPIDHVLY